MEKYKNRYGILVNKICASCAMKDITKTCERICQRIDQEVDARDTCDEWTINPRLENAGRASGRVMTKRQVYENRKRLGLV